MIKEADMDDPFISVIIPTFNRAHCIGDAIDSVLAQSFQDYEIIVVDDGSIDETNDVVKPYGDRIKLIRQENSGVSSARNAGIRAASGKWIAFLDSDDTWESEKLKVHVDDLQARPDAVAHMVDSRLDVPNDKQVSIFKLRGLQEEFLQSPFRERPLCDVLKSPFFTSTWMLSREAIISVGYFNTMLRIYEDIDLLTRLAMEGPFIINCYIGTNMRRIQHSNALSNLYQEERLEYFKNMLHTHSHLIKDPRLTEKERQCLCRLIGGIQCEIANQYRIQRNLHSEFIALLRSIAAEPGVRSVARVMLYAVGGRKMINRLATWRNGSSFRRSEQNCEAGRIDR